MQRLRFGKRFFLIKAIIPVFFLFALCKSGPALSDTVNFPHSTLAIAKADGQIVSLDIEIASSPVQHANGLMFRRMLPDHTGMLFVWDEDQPVSMWMKNTYIPLDMLFVRGDGTIARIASHTVPFDLTPIPSGTPVRGVVEIGDGEAEKLGLKTGDKIQFAGFSETSKRPWN